MAEQPPILHESGERLPLVWYASYGSNMDADRFACYIAGGTPQGGSRNYVGCEDKSLPVADMGIEMPQQLYFAGESKVWTGGLAFLSHGLGHEPTKGKAYLITPNQFEQVAAQESWRDQPLSLDMTALRAAGRLTMGDGTGNYDEMIYCGDQDGFPIISFTAPTERRPYTKPSGAYLRMISGGLRRAHDLSNEEVYAYLLRKPGIAENYTTEELAALNFVR
jgi:hypothetical protein